MCQLAVVRIDESGVRVKPVYATFHSSIQFFREILRNTKWFSRLINGEAQTIQAGVIRGVKVEVACSTGIQNYQRENQGSQFRNEAVNHIFDL